MEKLRVISWNLSFKGNIETKIKYLESVIKETDAPVCIALQEVQEKDYHYLNNEDMFKQKSFSLNFRKRGKYEGKNRELGCFIATVGPLQLNSSSLIDRVPFPERTLYGEVISKDVSFILLCCHSLTGVDYKKAKAAQFASIADFLYSHKEEVMICCLDANEPEIDHYDLSLSKFFQKNGDKGKCASLILGANSIHKLEDAYRIWLRENESEFNRIKEIQENNPENLRKIPLATSHIVNGGGKKRYDYIMIPSHWKVKHIEYRYEEAIDAGSDHAIVIADLEK